MTLSYQSTTKLYFRISLYVLFFAAGIVKAENDNGYRVYTQNCVVCHGEDGAGTMPGVPDLNDRRDWALLSEEQLLEQIKAGTQNMDLPVVMPPKGGSPDLSDDDIRDVIAYMRRTFSN